MPIAAPPAQVLQFLRDYSTYWLFSHLEPDGDCLTSSAALGRMLESSGKTVRHFNPGPFIRVEIQSYREQFMTDPPEAVDPDAAAVVLDCSTSRRIEPFDQIVAQMPCLVIDHHSNGDPFGDLRYIEATAASTTLLVHMIMEAAGHTLNADEARLLLFGLCTDTGFFRHVDVGQGSALAAAGRMVDAGAPLKEVYNRMFGGKSLQSRRLLAELIARAQELNEGRCLLTHETLDDAAYYGKHNRDSDLLYQLLMGTERCRVVALVRAETTETSSVSFRSQDGTDVGSLAKQLGGGGHRAAAGCQISAPLNDAIGTIAALLENIEFAS